MIRRSLVVPELIEKKIYSIGNHLMISIHSKPMARLLIIK